MLIVVVHSIYPHVHEESTDISLVSNDSYQHSLLTYFTAVLTADVGIHHLDHYQVSESSLSVDEDFHKLTHSDLIALVFLYTKSPSLTESYNIFRPLQIVYEDESYGTTSSRAPPNQV